MSRLDALRLKKVRSPAIALAVSLGALLLLIALKNLFTGTPDARLPANSLFRTPEISARDQVFGDEETGDFIERPLFSESRRPFVPEEQETPEAPEPAEPIPRQTLQGWSLLGIFNSGEVEGAIIRQSDGVRRRVLVGGVAGGWRLLSVEPRRAIFRSERSADEAELTMSLVSLEGLVRAMPTDTEIEGAPPIRSEGDAAAGEGLSSEAEKAEQVPQRYNPTVFGGGIKRDG